MSLNIKGAKRDDYLCIAKELCDGTIENLKINQLKELITETTTFVKDPEFVINLLISAMEERIEKIMDEKIRQQELVKLEKEKVRQHEEKLEKMRLEQEEKEKEKVRQHEQLEKEKARQQEEKLEKMRLDHELELARIQNNNQDTRNSNDTEHFNHILTVEAETQIEKLIKSVRTLSRPVPCKPEDWNLYFLSVERAFQTKKVPEDAKAEILINILGEKVTNILVNVTEEELKDYEYMKRLVLKEYEPSPQTCLENFRKARRKINETHVQFATRLITIFEYYCRLKKIEDLNQLKQLMVADKIFQTLDSDTAAHICIRQGENWLPPDKLAKECDLYFESKGRSFSENHNIPQRSSFNTGFHTSEYKYIPPPLRHDDPKNKFNNNRGFKNKECFICKSLQHIAKFCPQKMKQDKFKRNDRRFIDSKTNEDVIVAKVRSKYFGEENYSHSKSIVEIQPLKYVTINMNGRDVETIIDSGTQIPVINPQLIDNFERDDYGTIVLSSAFGEETKAKLVKILMAVRKRENGKLLAPIEVIAAITEKLKGPCLIPPEIYKMLEKENEIFSNVEIQTVNINEELTSYNNTAQNVNIRGVENVELRKSREEKIKCDSGVLCSNINIDGKEEIKDQVTENLPDSQIFKSEQHKCESLENVRKELGQNKGNFVLIDNVIYHKDKILGESVYQLVLPKNRRKKVLELAHESVFGAHMGVRKTNERIRYSFYWPFMSKDIKEFCKSCKNCQLRSTERVSDRMPITPVLRPELPFQVVNVDVIGPIEPPSGRGHKYILCIMDQHTRWPEAIPMRSLNAKSTCEALLQVFSRTGIPNIVASDQGTNFTSSLTQEFLKCIGASPRFSCPGYAPSNGLVERWNRVLKQMLHHIIREDPKNWDKQLPFLLFAYREVPNCTTGMSPFRLLYGREARGPLAVLKSTWSGEIPMPMNMSKTAVDYLQDLKIKMEIAAEQAALTTKDKQRTYTEYFNRRSSIRNFSIGDQVFLLIPDSTNKIYARWTGPGEIIEFCPPHSYKVRLPEGNIKQVHVNKIRRYHPRINTIGVIFEHEEEFGEIYPTPKTSKTEINIEELISNQNFDHLTVSQTKQIQELLKKHKSLFLGNVQVAKVDPHKITLTSGQARKKPYIYRIPETLKIKVDEQIEELLSLGLIEESCAEIAYPVVCVNKKDGSMRLCVDYRALNAVTIADDFPMEEAVQLINHIGKAKIITALDLLKGYWAIPMEKESMDFTSFRTHRGEYRFKVMPFGLKNAAATFQRVMNKTLSKYREFTRAYIDDIAIFSDDWYTHLEHLDLVFGELRRLGFIVNLKKCSFAKPEIKYLGHIIGSGKRRTDPDKIKAILQLSKPTTKKQLRSLIGLCNYYREYVPNYSEKVFALTELTKKKVPDIIPWLKIHDEAFKSLKTALADTSDLYTPVIGQPFIIQTDASQIGIAACLSQRSEGRIYPISFASQKLTQSQQNWSTIEREAYAVVWGLKKFEVWIFGAEIELFTDHNPLTFLTKCAPQSARLQRWAIALQKYNVTVKHCPGAQMNNADALSRLM